MRLFVFLYTFRAEHYAEHVAWFDRLSARTKPRRPAHVRESRAAVDRSRPRFNGNEHRGSSLCNHNHAQDTCVRNAPLTVSVEF